MDEAGHREGSSWARVVLVALVLLVAQVLPSPLGRHPAFSRVGPDKLLHLLGHAALAAALADALDTECLDERPSVLSAVALSTAYGVATAELQTLVPGRVPERADLVAGLLGAVLGALGWHRLTGDGPA